MNNRISEPSTALAMRAVESVGELATLPEVTSRIIEVVEDPGGTVDQLNEVIGRDPALAARVIRLVNSAFYGLPGRVSEVRRAILLLGQAAIRDLAISSSVGRMFVDQRDARLFDARQLWRHCIAVAVSARRISQSTRALFGREEVFLAGLIHDLGLLVEQQSFPEEVAEVRRRASEGGGDLLQLEQEVIGATHPEFGHALALKWRFPVHLREGVRCHHNPGAASEESRPLVGIVGWADLLCRREGYGFGPGVEPSNFAAWLEAAGVPADLWPRVCEGLEEEIEETAAVLGIQ